MRVLFAALLLSLLPACDGSDLETWHNAELDTEYVDGAAQSFPEYLELEERVYRQLDQLIYAHTPTGAEYALNRYSAGSAADPRQREPDWNRSFELVPREPVGGVLLLHGMSDSPYSLRALGQSLYAQGYRVLGLRLPGHGTIPAGLKTVHWQDMASAVRLAMGHLHERVGTTPIHIIGYSTGATLALDYSLDAKSGEAAPAAASLVLISPAVGLTPVAGLATWKRRLSQLPGMQPLAWLGIEPEFDPYKYNSFATNAAEQVHRLTRRVSGRLAARRGTERGLPPMLVFKSAVDATVSTDAVVDRLLLQLLPSRHELVLFDINRSALTSPLLVADPGPLAARLVDDKQLPFALTLVGNRDPSSQAVVVRSRPALAQTFATTRDIQAVWPRGVVSLSHVALPFPPDDPLYGRSPPGDGQLYLGQLPLQGERGLLRISSDWLLRLRSNPFYVYLQERTHNWLRRHGQAPAL